MAADSQSVSVCPHCGCRCQLIAFGDACGLGRIAALADAPVALVDGLPATLDAAVERAAGILSTAKSPLVYGLKHSTCEAQRAAVALADRIGAAIDIAGPSAAPLFPDLGTVTCSLGEVKNRADLVIFWGGRPHETYPRLIQEFAVNPEGRFLPNGRRDRTVIVVGEQVEADALSADLFFAAEPSQDFAALWLLRALVQSKPVDLVQPPVGGIAFADWQRLAERLRQCKFGVLFLSSAAHRAVEAAHGLATDLNDFTRFYALILRPSDNGVGAEQVLTWQTGYPAAVSLSAGYPRSFTDEFSAERMLSRGEADSVLLVGAGNLGDLMPTAQNHLSQIPVIALSPRNATISPSPAVAITTVASANSAPATAFRFDGLALPLKPAISSSFPSDFQVTLLIDSACRRMAAPG